MSRCVSSIAAVVAAGAMALVSCQLLLDTVEGPTAAPGGSNGDATLDDGAPVDPRDDAAGDDASAPYCAPGGTLVSLRYDFEDTATAGGHLTRETKGDGGVEQTDAAYEGASAILAQVAGSDGEDERSAALYRDLTTREGIRISWTALRKIRVRLAAKLVAGTIASADHWATFAHVVAGSLVSDDRSDAYLYFHGPKESEGHSVAAAVRADYETDTLSSVIAGQLAPADDWRTFEIELVRDPLDGQDVTVRFAGSGLAEPVVQTSQFTGVARLSDAGVRVYVGILSATQPFAVAIDDVTVDACLEEAP